MNRFTAWFVMILGLAATAGAVAALVNNAGGQDLRTVLVVVIVLGVSLVILGVVGLCLGRAGASGSASTATGNGDFKPNEMDDRELEGQPFQVFFKPHKSGKNGHPSALTISVKTELPTSLQFSSENWFDRLCKAVGIAREHQTGDARFDDLVYVRAPQESYAERYLADAAKREAVVALKEYGFHEIKVMETEAQARWTGFQPTTHDRPDLVADVARRLFTLTSNLPPADPQLDEPEWRIDWTAPLWTFVLLYGVSFGCAFWFTPVRVGELLQMGLLVFAVSWLILAWFAAFLLRGRSTSHDQWLVLMAVALVAMLLGSIGTVSAVNALADTAQPVERRVTISDKRISRSKKSTSYYLVAPDWGADGQTIEFSVSSADYSRAHPGQTEVLLVTSPGALGIEWLQSKEFRF